jgi:DNA polymerase III epsilon subunit-like protein
MARDEFLKSITVLDTETTNLIPEDAEIVEIAAAKYNGKTWDINDMLLGSKNPIPPEASAKNHISNRMIAGLPTFEDKHIDILNMILTDSYLVAHNSNYDQTVLSVSYNRCQAQSVADFMKSNDNWICTHRLAKKLLDFDFADMQYNLSFLRYKLDLPVPDDYGSHRANVDTFSCALLFEFLVDYALETNAIKLNDDIGKQLHTLCWSPFQISKWPWGKHKGKLLSEIETDYFQWAIKNLDALNDSHKRFDPDLAASVAEELSKRVA